MAAVVTPNNEAIAFCVAQIVSPAGSTKASILTKRQGN